MQKKLMSSFVFTALLSVGTLLGGCNLFVPPEPVESGLAKLKYNEDQFVKETDSSGREFLQGSGDIVHPTKLESESSLVSIKVSAKFPNRESALTVYSHMNAAFGEAYELRFVRLGDSIRLITSLNGKDAKSVGVVVRGIEDWKSNTVDLDITVDNSQANPSIKVRQTSLGGEAELLTETRTEGFPEGNRVGIESEDMVIYAFSVSEAQ